MLSKSLASGPFTILCAEMTVDQRYIVSLRAQRLLLLVSIVLMGMKFFAYVLTSSLAIFSDALESLVNVAAGAMGYYSLSLAAKPRDSNHPYGHGKAEFLSAAIEGLMIFVAGVLIIFESIQALLGTHTIKQLDFGLLLVLLSVVVNAGVGQYCVIVGQKQHSVALVSSGKHLMTDALTSVGLLVGLLMVRWTGVLEIDSWVAIIFAVIILISGLKILRKAISGIMDEADEKLVHQLVHLFQLKRKSIWIDIHHLRIVNYAGFFHIDFHMTFPRYLSVQEAHTEVEEITRILYQHFDGRTETSIHTDPCIPSQCGLCQVESCPVRTHRFENLHEWNYDNVIANRKHQFKKEGE